MKVVFHEDFYQVYTSDPAAEPGRIEAIIEQIQPHVQIIEAETASNEDLLAAHSARHVEEVKRRGLHYIASLAAGGAIQAAETGLAEPCMAVIRPPGHHASADSCWGFCYYNNMAVALLSLKNRGLIDTAFVLDFDLHFGDGNVNILEGRNWVRIFNPDAPDRRSYLLEVEQQLKANPASIIGISAGFDNHRDDWGGLLTTEDYEAMGRMAAQTAKAGGGGCFAILEGGYNHAVLGHNVLALLQGMSGA